jgi:hypothetical protein
LCRVTGSMLIEQNSRHTGLSVMRLCMAVAMWQAINWQRQTRERAGRVQGEGRWKWCWVGRIARPNPFLSPQPSPTAVLPRTLYFDRRASLGRHESFGTTPSLEACNVLRKLIRTMHCISITRTSLSIAIAFHCIHCTTIIKRTQQQYLIKASVFILHLQFPNTIKARSDTACQEPCSLLLLQYNEVKGIP